MDGEIQSAESDEKLYHGMLVNFALWYQAKNVLVIGGGELATARQVLDFPSVEKCTVVDIDEAVIKAAEDHLATWNEHVRMCERLKIEIADIKEWLPKHKGKFDCIISDLPGTFQQDDEYLCLCKKYLKLGGYFATHASLPDANGIYAKLKDFYGHVEFRKAYIPSFQGEWVFLIAR